MFAADTAVIDVYNDSCEAAQPLPDYEPIPGDINGDCIVNDLGLATPKPIGSSATP
jgi:hypothetical protein